MRFVIQVVQQSSLKVAKDNLQELHIDTNTIADYITEYGYEVHIQEGLLIYVGVSSDDLIDYQQKIAHFVSKIRGLQLFHRDGKLIGTLDECGGEILLIPNFTLYGKNRKGLRFDFTDSAPFADAKKVYEELLIALEKENILVKRGVFGAFMEITNVNAGPINFVMEI